MPRQMSSLMHLNQIDLSNNMIEEIPTGIYIHTHIHVHVHVHKHIHTIKNTVIISNSN